MSNISRYTLDCTLAEIRRFPTQNPELPAKDFGSALTELEHLATRTRITARAIKTMSESEMVKTTLLEFERSVRHTQTQVFCRFNGSLPASER